MLIATVPLTWRVLLFFLAGVAAGIANGVAGGGNFITFPTLLGLGVPALSANISTSVGIVPSYLGSIRLYRRDLIAHRALISSLLLPCVLGALGGCALLLHGSSSTFRSVVPYLIGAGTVLFALAPLMTRALAKVEHDHPARRWSLYVGVFLIAVYGGYFGAGMGIMLLALTALTLPLAIHELQGLRNVLSLVINLCAAIVFLIHGHLAVLAVSMLLVGTLVGGWLGALVTSRLSPNLVRCLVILVGAVTTIRLAIK